MKISRSFSLGGIEPKSLSNVANMWENVNELIKKSDDLIKSEIYLKSFYAT